MAKEFGFTPDEKDFVFASYYSRDKRTLDRTAEICRALHKRNLKIWYDDGITTGTDWDIVIGDHLGRCQVVIMFISTALLYSAEGGNKSGVKAEFNIAQRQKKKTVIPIIMDDIDESRIHNDFCGFYESIRQLQGIIISGLSTDNAADRIINRLKRDNHITAGFSSTEVTAQSQKPRSYNENISHRTATPLSPNMKVRVGDSVLLGCFPQKNGQISTIEWSVLKVNDGAALLLAKYGICMREYMEIFGSNLWSHSDMRMWLNNEFFNTAFTDVERKRIREIDIETQENPRHGTLGGVATTDRIFCLSIEEATKLMPSSHQRKATLFDRDGKAVSWWLRTPGRNIDGAAYIATVNVDGKINYDGEGWYEVVNYFNNDTNAVRPALWLDLSTVPKSSRKSTPSNNHSTTYNGLYSEYRNEYIEKKNFRFASLYLKSEYSSLRFYADLLITRTGAGLPWTNQVLDSESGMVVSAKSIFMENRGVRGDGFKVVVFKQNTEIALIGHFICAAEPQLFYDQAKDILLIKVDHDIEGPGSSHDYVEFPVTTIYAMDNPFGIAKLVDEFIYYY